MPPTGNLALSPYTQSARLVGQTQTFNVAAMDASGAALPNLLITLAITGANAHQLQATTDSTGLASFSYLGVKSSTDHVQAFTQIIGCPQVSSGTLMTW